MAITIYHNPRCRKSRETLQLLESKNIHPEIILYLKDVPTKSELKRVIKLLGLKPEALLRKGEKIYKEEYKGKELSDDEWIDAMIENPSLIERPIVIHNDKARLGRPPENVLELF